MNKADKPRSINDFGSKAKEWETHERRGRAKVLAEEIEKVISLNPEDLLLEIGAGTGLIGENFISRVKEIWFTDLSRGMVDAIIDKFDKRGVQNYNARVLNIEEETLRLKFNLIYTSMSLHHIEKYKAALSNMVSMLKENGRICLIDLDCEDGSFHPSKEEYFHAGIDRKAITEHLSSLGCEDLSAKTVHEIYKGGRSYPMFMITGRAPAP